MAKVFPPKNPVKLPLLEHNGIAIEPILHYGFSRDSRGRPGKERALYGARNPTDNERHWRPTYESIVALIDKNFEVESES